MLDDPGIGERLEVGVSPTCSVIWLRKVKKRCPSALTPCAELAGASDVDIPLSAWAFCASLQRLRSPSRSFFNSAADSSRKCTRHSW